MPFAQMLKITTKINKENTANERHTHTHIYVTNCPVLCQKSGKTYSPPHRRHIGRECKNRLQSNACNACVLFLHLLSLFLLLSEQMFRIHIKLQSNLNCTVIDLLLSFEL